MFGISQKNAFPKFIQGRRYVVRQLLGRGSTGFVYKVYDTELSNQPLALKQIHPHIIEEESALERFRSQVILTRQMSHPNVVQVYDFDRDQDNRYFITMEFVDGSSLESVFSSRKNEQMSFDEMLDILVDIAKALEHAHGLGIVHRDLKPSNVLLSFNGQVKLADFGLAKSLENTFGLTQTGEILGSANYSAPEQFRGEPTTARADVYSFGVLAYQLATGSLPFEGDSFFAQADAHQTQLVPSTRLEEKSYPQWFIDFLSKCCEKNPQRRYQSGKELVGVLREHLKSTDESQRRRQFTFFSEAPQSSRLISRSYKPLMLSALLLLSCHIALKQTSVRRFLGVSILTAESFLGHEFVWLKSLLSIKPSILRPQDFLAEVSEPESARYNIPIYLRAGGRMDMTDAEGNTIAHLALDASNTTVYEELVNRHFDLNVRNSKGETPLLRSVRHHRGPASYWLLRQRADPNLCDLKQNCPLQVAVDDWEEETVSNLLNFGADRSLPNREGKNALHILAERHEAEKLQKLLAYPRHQLWHLDSRSPEGLTPLMFAVKGARPDPLSSLTIKFLLAAGSNVHTRDNEGRTPLIYAILSKDTDTIRQLLAAGSDTHITDGAGKSIETYAKEANLSEDLLKELQK